MYKQIYPVIGDEKNLPFYVVGLGLESWQFPIKRADGYEYPQIFLSRSGEGECHGCSYTCGGGGKSPCENA